MEPVIYLDNWALCNLVREPDAPGSRAVRQLLSDGRGRLAISLMHFIETSHPGFSSFPRLLEFLRDHPPVMGFSQRRVFELEIRNAWRVVLGGHAIPFEPFARTLAEWGEDGIKGEPLPFLEFFGLHPEYHQYYLREATETAARYTAAKARGGAFHLEVGALPKFAEMYAPTHDLAGVALTSPPCSPKAMIREAGGLAGFPGYQVFNELLRFQLEDSGAHIVANDLIDQNHALYAPYAAVTVLESKVVHRFAAQHLPSTEWVTHNLTAVPDLLARRFPAAA